MPVTKDFAPRLQPAPQAAHYIGVSPSKLATLGIPRKVLDGKRLYDRHDLDAYVDELPYEGAKEGEESKCDAADQAWQVAS
ncbi:DNA-binding protein [uncultured Roseobacter sp.]|uniref:DNA-binding protein n=1 Tax=uncultured Roseobacter sp. TaxID=114847 RepID=UPI00261FCC69|nr:DNA-binding protein [uncultured Roseobacter sp.]